MTYMQREKPLASVPESLAFPKIRDHPPPSSYFQACETHCDVRTAISAEPAEGVSVR